MPTSVYSLEMSSSTVAVVLSLAILGLSDGLNKKAEKEFASGLLHVLDMEHAPNISSRRHDIPRYVLNLYKGKFARKPSGIGGSTPLGSTTRIFFPQGNTTGCIKALLIHKRCQQFAFLINMC